MQEPENCNFIKKILVFSREFFKFLKNSLFIEHQQTTASVTCFMIIFLSAGIYLLKANNENTRTMYEICSNLTVKTPEWTFEYEWIFGAHCSGVSIFHFQLVNTGWAYFKRFESFRSSCAVLLCKKESFKTFR